MMARMLHSKIQSGLVDSIQQKLPEINAQVQRLATARVQKDLAQNTAHLQQLANLQLDQLAQKGQDVLVPTHNPLARDMHLGLDGMKLSDGNLVLSFDAPGAPAGTAAALPAGVHLRAGQFAVALDGANLNRQLNDQSQGGVVDWKAVLGQIKQTGKREIAVLGCGAVGLATARLLQ